MKTLLYIFMLLLPCTQVLADCDANDFKTTLALAEGGDAEAQLCLGYKYDFGEGVKENQDIAIEWYEKAAIQGLVEAQKALTDSDRIFPRKRVKWLKKLADQGDAGSQDSLGFCYAKGLGLPKNERKAIYWYKEAGKQGFKSAYSSLGLFYHGKEDTQNAIIWFEKSLEESPEWGAVLAELYTKDGKTQNLIRAHMFFNLAAANGNEGGSKERDNVAKKMTEKEIETAEDLADKWMDKYDD